MRQRIWYALRRNGLTFAFPTRTLYLERQSAARPITADDQIADRLSAVDIFAPLSPDELRQLSKATVVHVFAPGETLIRAGDEETSMFVVHNGRVAVQSLTGARLAQSRLLLTAISSARWRFYRRPRRKCPWQLKKPRSLRLVTRR